MDLAVRVDAPIYVAPMVLEEAGIPTEEEGVSAMASSPPPEEEPQMSRLERMEQQLAEAIQEENYEKAAKLRDELAQMKGKQN